MKVCDYCGKEITGGYYRHNHDGYICGSGDCFNKQFWKDTLDNSVIVINGKAYHESANKEGTHCTVKLASGVIKEMYLWLNGDIPKEYNIKNNAEFI